MMNLIAVIVGILGTAGSVLLGDYGMALIQAILAAVNLHFYQINKEEENGK